MVYSFIFLDREKIQSNIIKDFQGKDIRKTKRILWDFKRMGAENFIEEYAKLLKLIPKDEYNDANFTKREYYAIHIDEARRDYAYFFLDLYDMRGDVGKRFLKKKFDLDDIELLLDVVEPMEKVKALECNSEFDKKEAFDYFRGLYAEKLEK